MVFTYPNKNGNQNFQNCITLVVYLLNPPMDQDHFDFKYLTTHISHIMWQCIQVSYHNSDVEAPEQAGRGRTAHFNPEVNPNLFADKVMVMESHCNYFSRILVTLSKASNPDFVWEKLLTSYDAEAGLCVIFKWIIEEMQISAKTSA